MFLLCIQNVAFPFSGGGELLHLELNKALNINYILFLNCDLLKSHVRSSNSADSIKERDKEVYS